ncbi:hypothetical protein FRC06_009789 [Ceratobasidium sp. 370]|nr:hypothetical protein FRC06_009789 [Ceratobasidium sp. 370]
MLHLFDSHRTFQHIVALLAENELEMPAVPFAMRHAISMLDQIFEFTRQAPEWRGGNHAYRSLTRSVRLQLAMDGMSPAVAASTPPTELIRSLFGAWISQLEELKDRVPEDILNSGVLDLLLRASPLNSLSERLDDLLQYCTTRASAAQNV